jgi:Lon-like protease
MLPPDSQVSGGTVAPAHDTDEPPAPPPIADEGGAPRPWTRKRWVWALGLFVFVVGSAIVTSFFVKVPYYAFSPGNLYDTETLVTVSGPSVDDPDGQLMLTTIAVSQERLTAWRAFVGWLDPAVSVHEEVRVVGDSDRETVRQENLQRMTSSQDIATYVALDRLGYEVGLTGSGAFVALVQPGSAADGLLEHGDTVVAIDGEPVELASDLVTGIGAHAPGDTVVLTVEPAASEESETVDVVLGENPDDPTAPLLGVQVETRDGAFVMPDGIEVDFADSGIGGPSAGLVFTLTIIDDLSPGDLTGGETVAFTGEMGLDGTVGPIGGIEQKVVTVRRAGVDTFIIPAGLPDHEMEAARRQAGDAVDIIEVATLDEALDVLESLGGDPVEELDAAA